MANRILGKAALRRRKRSRTNDPQRTRLVLEWLEDRCMLAGDATIQGTKFYDLNGDGLRDANEPGLEDWTIYVDTDHSGDLTPGEPVAITDSQGNYTITGVPIGSVDVREQLRPGWQQMFPSQGFHNFGTTPGETISGIDFGNRISDRALFGEIRGSVWNDTDQNGQREASEPGIEGWQIYLDQNNNSQLDAGERYTFTGADGSFSFGKLPPVAYTVRAVVQAGWQQSFPASGSHSVAIEEGQVASFVDFGNHLDSPGEIRGVKWNDANGNGLLDQNESLLPGVKIFLDDNHNGQVDPLEPFAFTDSQGAYLLSKVSPGPHTVAEVLPDSYLWRQNFPGVVKDFVPSPLTLVPFAPPNVNARANGVFAGDFDRNGQLDLATFDANRGVVSLMLNQGQGNFASPEELDVGTGILFALFGDVNHDGAPDIVTVANVIEPFTLAKRSNIVTRLNDGSNSFPVAATLQLDGVVDAGTLAEINHDGNLDLLLTRFLRDGDLLPIPSVLLNDGTGAFLISENAILPETNGGSSIARDFDKDGFVDLVRVESNLDQLQFFRNLWNGTFAAPVVLQEAAFSNPVFVTAGDLDGNGFLDLVAANQSFGPGQQTVSVFLNQGGGNFSAEARYDSGATTVAATLADFDGDHDLDIVTANRFANNVSILLNNGSGSFGLAATYPVGSQPGTLVAGDWNGDHLIDLAVGNAGSNDVSILLNTTSAGLLSFANESRYALGGSPVSLASGYLDGDTDLDLIAVLAGQFVSTTKRELLNNGDGTFAAAQDLTYDRTNRQLIAADLTGDGYADWIEVPDFTHDILVYLNAGNGNYKAPTHIDLGSRPNFVSTGDVNGDGSLDLSVALLDSNQIITLLNDGSGHFTSKGATSLGHPPIGIIGADLNGDGFGDWVTSSGVDGVISWLKSRGDGTYDSPRDWTEIGTGVITSGDWNGDGHLDLVTSLLGSSLGVLYNSITPDFGHWVDITPGGSLANQDFGNQRRSWKNPLDAMDVNADGFIVPMDALIVINYLNDRGPGRFDLALAFMAPFYDVNGDDTAAPNDIIIIINHLNGASAEGEGAEDDAGPSGFASDPGTPRRDFAIISAAKLTSTSAAGLTFGTAQASATTVYAGLNSFVLFARANGLVPSIFEPLASRADLSSRAAATFARAVDWLWSRSAVAITSSTSFASNSDSKSVDARLRQTRHELLTNDLDALLAELAPDITTHRWSS